MKLLVTGGAGYVGSTLVPELLGRGHQVRVLDNLMYGQQSLLACFRDRNFQFVRGDIRDQDAVRKAVAGRDGIIHLAAIVGAPACQQDPRLAEEVNALGTANIEKARGRGQLLVFASTGSNYGAVEGVCTEETPLIPVSVYGRTKTEAEQCVMESGNAVTYRFAGGFGLSPRLRLDLLVNDFAFQAVKNGYILLYEKHFRRTFIHVSDMARALVHAVEGYDRMVGEAYNVGGEELNYTKEEVALAIQKKVDYQLYFADFGSDLEKRDYAVSYGKLRETGFQVQVGLEEGLDELIAGYEMVSVRNPYSNM